MAVSPSTSNYTIGKGILSLQKTGDTTWIDLGNAPKIDFSVETEQLDHFSSRSGIKTVDLSVAISRKGKLTITLDEITEENLAIALYGKVTTGTIEGFAGEPVEGALKFVGSNDIGPKWQYEFKKCLLVPTGTLSLIGDSWMEIELEATVGADDTGKFFDVTPVASGSPAAAPAGP